MTIKEYTKKKSIILSVNLFDYWLKLMAPSEFKVLALLIKKTNDWNCNTGQISVKSIGKITGLYPFTITRSLEALIDMGLISVKKAETKGTCASTNSYTVHFDMIDSV